MTMKLTYFPVRGRVEPARLMLELAGVHYKFEPMDVTTWMGPEGKQRMLQRTPFGQLPLLEDGALALCQSRAIHRYLARKLKLYGDTIEEQARIDEVFETADDIVFDVVQFFWNPQFNERRAEHRETTRTKLERLESYFTRTSPSAGHWALAGRYTLADVVMAYALESLMPLHPGLVEDCPKIAHAMTAFFASGGVGEYVRSDRRAPTWTIPMASFGGKPEETHHWAPRDVAAT
jgi:glutathione S-transferase